MMDVKFSRYDTVNYLKTKEDITAYLDAVMENGDPRAHRHSTWRRGARPKSQPACT
ncbi:DNA-binding protein [Mesorhizobium retamae]|uniref:helix-turn-helix domain-containing transcriptional regulator n=1 Tax=Mesorhizobium retamae TaxID=2912854 RepID=UPI0031B9CB9B